MVEKVELRFDWGFWGNLNVRTVVGGDLYLKSPTTLTVSNRGDRTPIELFIAGTATLNMAFLRHFIDADVLTASRPT